MVNGGVHGLSGGGKRAGSQHLDLLRVSDSGTGIDGLLLGLLQLSSEVPKLRYLSFDKGISQLLYGSVDNRLIGVPRFEYALSKGIEGGLHTVARSSAQFDGENGVTFTHSEVGARTDVVEYESHKFCLPLIVVGVVDGR